MLIDSHHHFWKYNPIDYDWIDNDMSAIRRDFLPDDLAMVIANAGIDGVVSVQARQSLDETDWLLSMAHEAPFIKGVVGWLPIADTAFPGLLEKYLGYDALKSLRHVIQGEPDDEFILRRDFNQGIKLIGQTRLAYDILIFERHLPQTTKFVDRHPNQLFVLDHIAKPRIARFELSPWRENIVDLAKRPNVYCKLSGMVTEADYTRWTEAQLKPYFDTVLEAFGPHRLMFGSDWPVCQVAVDYVQWLKVVRNAIGGLSVSEQKAVLGGNAAKVYQLSE